MLHKSNGFTSHIQFSMHICVQEKGWNYQDDITDDMMSSIIFLILLFKLLFICVMSIVTSHQDWHTINCSEGIQFSSSSQSSHYFCVQRKSAKNYDCLYPTPFGSTNEWNVYGGITIEVVLLSCFYIHSFLLPLWFSYTMNENWAAILKGKSQNKATVTNQMNNKFVRNKNAYNISLHMYEK